jgi:hypothetical protein
MMKTLLITSVGSLVSHNVLDCLDRLGRPYCRIGVNSIADAPGNFRCDVAYLVPPAAREEEYLARLAEIIDRHNPDLVIPGRDIDVVLLAELRRRRGDDPRFLCGGVGAARIFSNKRESALFAARHGLPFVESAQTLDEARELASRFGYPLIAKPADGYGSNDVFAVLDADGLERAVSAGLLIQRFLSPPAGLERKAEKFAVGVPLSYAVPVRDQIAGQAIIGPDGKVIDVFATIYDLASGYAVRVRRFDCPAFDRVLRRYARAAADEGHIGSFNLQGGLAPDGATAPFELGARFTGSTSSRALLGWDEVDMVLRRFVHGAEVVPPARLSEPPIVFKALGEFVVATGDIAALAAAGHWRRAG